HLRERLGGDRLRPRCGEARSAGDHQPVAADDRRPHAAGRDTDSMRPRSQLCRRTRSMTVAEFSTDSPMPMSGWAARKVVRWWGMRYSATVSEALTLTVPARAS